MLSAWVALPDMPTPRAAAGTSVLGDFIVVAGGFQDNPPPEDDDKVVDAVELFDTKSCRWQTRAPLPVPMMAPGLAVVGKTLYAAGGQVTARGEHTAQTWAYDADKDAWSRRSPMPAAAGGAAVAVGRRLLFFAGNDEKGRSGRVFAYEPRKDAWSELSPRPSRAPIRGSAVAAVGDKVYVLAGVGAGSCSGTLEVYDAGNDSWSDTGWPGPSRCWRSLAAAEGKLYVLGGTNDNGETKYDAVLRYDPFSGALKELPSLPEALQDGAAAVVGRALYSLGGWNWTPKSVAALLALDGSKPRCRRPDVAGLR